MPTLMSWVGQKTLKEELLTGKEIAGKNYKVHLDGYDQSDILLNQGKSKRKEFYYFTENTFHGMRYGDWKLLFIDQEEWFRAEQVPLTSPYIIFAAVIASHAGSRLVSRSPSGASRSETNVRWKTSSQRLSSILEPHGHGVHECGDSGARQGRPTRRPRRPVKGTSPRSPGRLPPMPSAGL